MTLHTRTLRTRTLRTRTLPSRTLATRAPRSRSLRAGLAGAVLAAALATGPAVALAPQASAATPYCGITWGSLARTRPAPTVNTVTGIRAGRHACYDRLVIDIAGTRPTGFDVRYVTAVEAQGSGQPVPLRGGARLAITVHSPAYTGAGRATYRPANRLELVDVAGYSTFRQVAWGGSFEGQTTIGLGVRARLPYRVFTLTDTAAGTTRVVIDVAHRWS